jgi:hypothetical protein
MTAFFEAFWPNLAATIIGVVLGVPIALWLNGRILNRQRKLQIDDHHRQIENSLVLLISACTYNIRILDTMREEAQAGRVMHAPDLRITTWDVVASFLGAGALDPDLLQIISHHWLRLKRIQVLSDEIFAREVTKSLPAIADQSVMLEFWQVLHGNARDLAAHAGEVIGRLETVKSKLGHENAA